MNLNKNRRIMFVLVPKLCLGTGVLEALLPDTDPSKQSLLDVRSQAELHCH